MALSARVREKSSAIARRWLAGAMTAYPADSAALFRRERDPFANPVGRALRVGTLAVVEALCEGREPEEICSHLDEIVKIRAVQEFAPSRAVSFVFLLKEAIRAELGPEDAGGAFASELAELDGRIDGIALGAFDVYMHYRGRVYELRMNEVKRSVARLIETMKRRRPPHQSDEERLPFGPLECDEAQRGSGQ